MSDASDIDVLVNLKNPAFDNYMDLKFCLEELFERPVDLVVEDSIKPRLKNYIMEEVRFAAGIYTVSGRYPFLIKEFTTLFRNSNVTQ